MSHDNHMKAQWRNTGEVVEVREHIAHITFEESGQVELRFYGGTTQKAKERFAMMLAAPELLEALEHLMCGFSGGTVGVGSHHPKTLAAKAAIAKARGENAEVAA